MIIQLPVAVAFYYPPIQVSATGGTPIVTPLSTTIPGNRDIHQPPHTPMQPLIPSTSQHIHPTDSTLCIPVKALLTILLPSACPVPALPNAHTYPQISAKSSGSQTWPQGKLNPVGPISVLFLCASYWEPVWEEAPATPANNMRMY